MFVTTTVHPHPASRFIQLDVVAVDLQRARVHFMLGTDDHGAKTLAAPGLIPESDQPALVAVFNGGFQARHGWWGVTLAGNSLLPLKEIGCSVALDAEGQVAMGSWKNLSAQASRFVTVRQTPPCLVEQGEIHPFLGSGRDRMWAGKNEQRKTRRRSAVGIDETGTVLFYALGTETSALLLARGMAAVGASEAAQLDINWNWTRFLFFGEVDGQLRVTSTLIDPMNHGKTEYVRRATARDFFYITRRD